MLDEYEFALCLTHDVDRPYKTFQAPYYAIKERNPSHLRSLVSSDRPYWQFEEIMQLEEELGVRSSFYFLNEKNLFREKTPLNWFKPKNWRLFTGRYDISNEEIVDMIHTLDEGGWEVGLHGSYESYNDLDRLRYEKEVLEEILGHEVIGGRQHYLNLDRQDTWRYHQEIGLKYDSSLGSVSEYGFNSEYKIRFPFDNDFAVFPITVMEQALIEDVSDLTRAYNECKQLLREAKANDAVMTVLWHQKMFNEADFHGYRNLYKRLIMTAKTMDAWIGPPGKLYQEIVEYDC